MPENPASYRVVRTKSYLFNKAGTEQSLAPFRATEATFLVNDITAWEKHLPSTGATIINPVKAVPTGWNMLVRHPDGMIAEYVEHHDKNPADEIF